MTPIYILVAALTLVTAIVLLSFLGPEKSDRPFWKAVRKVRAVMDLCSYWIINALAVSCIVLVVVLSVRALLR